MDIYEQKYKEALEKASKLRVQNPFDTVGQMVEYIFPEFKESEDERIRKDIIWCIEHSGIKSHKPINPHATTTVKEALTWLEKQKPVDEEELKKGALKYVACQFMKWLDASIPEDEMCLSNAECKVIEDAFLKDDWVTISHYMCEKLKRQGEQIELKKVKQDNHPRIVMADFNGGEGFFKLNLDNLNKEQVDAIEMMINNPKQSEQTQLDYEHVNIPQKDFAPIEPKFKVGDWVVRKDEESFANGNHYARITNIDDEEQYWFDSGSWLEAEDIRLWTIQDAKDGDLIYVSTELRGIQAIFHKFENGIIYFHCNLCANFTQGGYELSGNVESVHPLQKIHYQRFFQKMKEAGYEWDTDKKEVKEIEL